MGHEKEPGSTVAAETVSARPRLSTARSKFQIEL